MSATAQKVASTAIFMLIAIIGAITTLYLESMNTRMDRVADAVVRVEVALIADRDRLSDVLVSLEHRMTLLEARGP